MSQGEVAYQELAREYPALFGMYGQAPTPAGPGALPARRQASIPRIKRLTDSASAITDPQAQALVRELVEFMERHPVWVEGRIINGGFVLFLKADDQWRGDNAAAFSAFKQQRWPKMFGPLLRYCWPAITPVEENNRGSFAEP